MAQRNSGYERINGDTYVTPRWVYESLAQVESFSRPWDCAPADAGFDFLHATYLDQGDIVTNPLLGYLPKVEAA